MLCGTQVLARYPNAKWSDKSVFYAVKNWFRSKDPGVHNLTSGEVLESLSPNIKFPELF